MSTDASLLNLADISDGVFGGDLPNHSSGESCWDHLKQLSNLHKGVFAALG